MTLSEADRIELVRSNLAAYLQAFKDEFFPFRSQFETQVSGEIAGTSNAITSFGNAIPGGFDGTIGAIGQLIKEGTLPQYSRGQWVRNDDFLNKNGSAAWVARVKGDVDRLADMAAGVMGTTWNVSAVVSGLGITIYKFSLALPEINPEALKVQAALTDAFGSGWPLKTADQIEKLNLQVKMYQDVIANLTKAAVTNPGSAALFNKNISKYEIQMQDRIDFIAFIKAGALPSDVSPAAVLSNPAPSIPLIPSIDEATAINAFSDASIALQTPEVVAEQAQSAKVLTDAFAFDPVVKDAPGALSTPTPSVLVDDPNAVPVLGTFGTPANDIPAPVAIDDPGTLGKTVPVPTFDPGSPGGDFIDGVVSDFNGFAGSFDTGISPTRAVAPVVDPGASTGRKALLIALVSAIILRGM